jgi:hypothetical protein
MKTIQERWTDFETRCLDPDAPTIQHREMRLAFFAGAKALLDVTSEIAAIPDERACIEALETFHREARAFGQNG